MPIEPTVKPPAAPIAIRHCLGAYEAAERSGRITLVLQDVTGALCPLDMDLATGLAIGLAVRADIGGTARSLEDFAPAGAMAMAVWEDGQTTHMRELPVDVGDRATLDLIDWTNGVATRAHRQHRWMRWALGLAVLSLGFCVLGLWRLA